MNLIQRFRLRSVENRLRYHEESLQMLKARIADHERAVKVARNDRAKLVGATTPLKG